MIAPCPCGGAAFDACCGPVVRNERTAATAEELMRSRYTAYVVGDEDHLFRSWHPRTRPSDVSVPATRWTGLEILGVTGGGPEDEAGEVEFVASYDGGALHERSRFERRGGRWVYVDGDTR